MSAIDRAWEPEGEAPTPQPETLNDAFTRATMASVNRGLVTLANRNSEHDPEL